MSQLIKAHSRQHVIDECRYATAKHTLVDAHIRPEGFPSRIAYLDDLCHVCQLSYDPDEA